MPAEERRRRNPFKNEADAFRIVVMFVAAALVVILATAIVGSWLGALAAAGFIIAGIWAAVGWLRVGLGEKDE